MTVQGISAGTVNYNAAGKKKMDAVKKGALIGGGIQAASTAIGVISLKSNAKQAGVTFTEVLKACGLSKGKYVAMIAAGVALTAGIGAGIGKLVKNHNEKKEEKQANIDANA